MPDAMKMKEERGGAARGKRGRQRPLKIVQAKDILLARLA